ncbi:GNAT family N-acetyltransferase [Glutamicibacter protophormiae]|uniref:GNAT family N-acetyltransferase n=1 Tax=Glutamicibacter protophormiae TaxID=37930 RepID=UPI002A8406E5|nr:GNAT family N-acetyltransferase [Glutamicibacter protophormiae]WPR65443.1 GNAT family N-acetyltransferase [Glutamicibacter protophormiae]WPR68941.1 GNAT family N-acetyltransferase [Glutamicibacter protophormiae]
MEDLSIRIASLDDVQAIRSIGLITWPATYLGFTSPDFVMNNLNTWWSHESVSASITDDTTFIASQGEQAVGTLTLGRFEDEPVIWKIYVVPEAHGQGIGTALMNVALAAVGPAQDVRIEFVKGNDTAYTFYERRGFKFDFEEDMDEGFTTVWLRRPALI